MYQLFQLDSRLTTGGQRHPSWHTINRGLVHALRTVTDFYKSHTMSVKTDHVLSRIIAPFGAGAQYEPRDFYMRVMDEASSVARTLKLTSTVQAGVAHAGQFYGPGVREVLLATDSAFDYGREHLRWELTQAVRVLSHPVTNLALDLPDGINRSGDEGVAVVEINIPKLLIQYHAFRRSEAIRKQTHGLPERSTYQFIHRFVLPNMMRDHLHHVLINRLRATVLAEEISERRPGHSFYIPDWSREVNQFHDQLSGYLIDKTQSMVGLMRSIPLTDEATAFDYATLPRVIRTQQVKWALALSRLDLLEILVYASVNGNGNPNRNELNAIKREIERYRIDRTLSQVMPRELYNATLFRWERLSAML